MRLLLLVLALVATACTFPDLEAAPEPDGVDPVTVAGDTTASTTPTYAAPSFPDGLDWLNTDAPVALEDLRGKIVLLDFWTYGCINCIHVIPDLKRLEAEYPDELVVIGVHSAKFETEAQTESIREIVLRYDVTHPVVNDSGFQIWRDYGVRAWPTVWLIGPDGSLVGRHEGEGVYETVQPAIDQLLVAEDVDTTPLAFSPEERVETILAYPTKLALDPDRGLMYVADTGHDQVVAVSLETAEVVAVYGSGSPGSRDGAPEEATVSGPRGLAVAADGRTVYVADTGNHVIRAIDVESGLVTTIAGVGRQGSWPPMGGDAGGVALHSPWDLELADDVLYIAMAGSHQIWALDLVELRASPYAGSGREATDNGPRRTAALAQPSGLATDGDRLWFADSESSSIRVVQDDTVDLVAGAADGLFDFGLVDAVGSDARFQHPLGVAWDGSLIWVADTYNSAIRAVDPSTGAVTTVVGGEAGWADGPDPKFDQPGGIEAWDGRLFIADTNNHSIRVFDPEAGTTNTLILSGMERFRRPAEDGVVTLESVTVSEGAVRLSLDLTVPEGYKVNPEAPASIAWGGNAGPVSPESVTLTEPRFPLRFELEVTSPGTLIGDVALVYCEEEQESVCLFEQVRFEVPVVIDVSGGDSIEVVHGIELPDGLAP
jgi:DNA-binding beta-propeller fold protein YncE